MRLLGGARTDLRHRALLPRTSRPRWLSWWNSPVLERKLKTLGSKRFVAFTSSLPVSRSSRWGAGNDGGMTWN